MKRWLVPALAALALFGCQKAPEEKTVPREARPVATQALPERPAPQPDVVTNAQINQCKNDWVADQATELRTSTAEVERRARHMRAAPNMKVTVNGMSVAFTKTIWHSCEVAIEASRTTAQAQAAPAAQDPNLVTLTHQQYSDLRAAAYENPQEADPAKLRGYREAAARLEVERDNLSGFTPMHGLCIFLGLALGAFLFWLFNRPKKAPTKARRDLPREDPRPSAPTPDSERPAPAPGDFT